MDRPRLGVLDGHGATIVPSFVKYCLRGQAIYHKVTPIISSLELSQVAIVSWLDKMVVIMLSCFGHAKGMKINN